jgi:predicted dehydrogenase
VISVAISGCGAATRIYHQPALSRLQAAGVLRVAAAYDPDPQANRTFCHAFPGASEASSFAAMIDSAPELLIVASPPHQHAPQSIAALRAGVDVLCEKPMATSVVQAEAMAAEAHTTQRLLAVGMVRRHLGAARLVKGLLDRGTIGAVQRIDVFEGGPFSWPISSPDFFRPESGGIGVLEDIGSHVLDLFRWWLGEPEIIDYVDDAMGGIAANCRIELQIGELPVAIRLSRDWARPNGYHFLGPEGWIHWADLDPEQLEFGLAAGSAGARVAAHDLGPDGSEIAGPAGGFPEAFARQLLAIIDARSGGPAEIVRAEDAVRTVRLIERCHAIRKVMDMPWLR